MTEGLHAVGPVVVLTGPVLRVALDAVLIAVRNRQLSGVSTDRYRALGQALAAALASADGHSDVRETVEAQHLSLHPQVPVDEAAKRLNRSERQTRRLARKLGGRKVGRVWFLDEEAIEQHLEGKAEWTEGN